MYKKCKIVVLGMLIAACCNAQADLSRPFTHADTLRGMLNPERTWWDVLRYDITVQPDYNNKTTAGNNVITYKVTQAHHPAMLQIDLQQPLQIDSIVLDRQQRLQYTREGNAWHVQVPAQQQLQSVHRLAVFFSGKPKEGIRPPWVGGWTFAKDSLNRPWLTVTCQALGASVWFPCKDHQSDEPDKGASLSMIVPDTLVAVANGRLQSQTNNHNGTATYTWAVVNPINNYDIIPYIGKYVHFGETYAGEKGPLTLDYWVLDYNLNKAKEYMPKEVHQMLKAFEYWMGPYPFYEDGYKLVDAPHTGMEHQSAVAYGNWYKPGYRLRDGSGTGLGLKWDFIIVHESGHEWFGNNITSKDLADMWVHEGFTNYSETLFVDYMFGKEAGNDYNAGIRKGIRNDRPVTPPYNVNAEGSGDMYPKASNMLHAIRHSIDNDSLFRGILRGLGKTFYHQTVTAQQVEEYVSAKAGFNYSTVFRQYLLTTQVPNLEIRFNNDHSSVQYRWTHCVPGFNLPLVLKQGGEYIRVYPTEQWKSSSLKKGQDQLFDKAAVVKMYYITAS